MSGGGMIAPQIFPSDVTLDDGADLIIDDGGAIKFNAADVVLLSDVSKTLSLRNGTNEQNLRLYNSYLDSENNEYLRLQWNSNICLIEATAMGTGTRRALRIGGSDMNFLIGGVVRLSISSSGHLWPEANVDLGLAGAPPEQFRTIYVRGHYAPAAAQSSQENSTVSFWLDEAGHNLKFLVKYSNGTTKTGTLAVA